MGQQLLLHVFTRNRKLRLVALIVLLTAFVPARALGQHATSVSTRASILKSEPGKIWTEDDLAGLLKPWDFYQIAQEKKAMIKAAAPLVEETPDNSNINAAAHESKETPVSSNNAVLRAMDSRQFHNFLKTLDSDLVIWQARLNSIDVKRLAVGYREQEEIERRYDSCQEAVKHVRDEVTKVSQDQTLKLDILLLIDLNALARNLDGLTVNLASPITAEGLSAAQESLEWAKQALRIDEELAPRIAALQYHTLELAGVWETALGMAPQFGSQAQ